jgi:arsenate reductase (glutaredoxin)
MMAVTIYHNSRCSKSRQTLALIQARGIQPRVVEYLKTPPDRATILALLRKLGIPPRDLLRRNEPEFASLGLDGADVSDDALIDAMAAHPNLIERPIVVVDRRARIGRPPEAVLELLP